MSIESRIHLPQVGRGGSSALNANLYFSLKVYKREANSVDFLLYSEGKMPHF